MDKLVKLLVFAFALTSCNSRNTQQAKQEISGVTKDSFFPVTSFIKGQLHELDSIPITPLYITSSKGKTDSLWIKRDSLSIYLHPFINDEINETNLTPYFTESKFNDLSIERITFTYDTKGNLPETIHLKHWDVYINPETGKVARIYIVKEFDENKNHITQQLTWNTDRWAKIVTITGNPNSPAIKEETFIWQF